MKTAFISDIHGNFEALEAVLAALDRLGVERIYCLGDVVGYYPQVNEVCDELRARDIPCLMGNHDWYLAGAGFCPRSKSVNDCLVLQRKTIREENLQWLKTFPVFREADGFKMVHGGWADPVDEYLKPSEEYFSRLNGELFVSGHTHLPVIHRYGDKTYCNPGSVGQPRDQDPRASFAVFDREFSIHRVEYDPQKVFDLMKAAGFDDYYYGGLKYGSRNLRKL